MHAVVQQPLGEGGGGTYLRRGTEAQSWLAEGEVTLVEGQEFVLDTDLPRDAGDERGVLVGGLLLFDRGDAVGTTKRAWPATKCAADAGSRSIIAG